LKLALEAFANVIRPGVILVVAGDYPQRDEFRTLAETLGVMPRIRWLGFRPDIHRIYAAADAFLFPSAYEAFSLATIEAAATGLPVMMSDISGASELLGDGRGGAIVDRSAAAISAVMAEWVDQPELRRRMGIEAREKVERDFHWDHIADQTERFYERLLRHRTNNRCQVESA
jgi:glycosyltransferase involved in cell wall biosynthesis